MSIITWLAGKLGISTLIVQIAFVAIISGGAFWWLKSHDAKIAEQYKREGVLQGIKEEKKRLEEKWKIEEQNREAEKRLYEERIVLQNKAVEELEKRVAEWKIKYNDIKNNVEIQIVEIEKEIIKIPKDKLIDTIRRKSAALILPTPLTVVEDTGVLAENESRLVLGQLEELNIRRNEVISYNKLIEEDKLLDKQKEENFTFQLETEKLNVKIVKEELKLMEEKMLFFENSYNTCSKGRSKKCWVVKILTLGMGKC
jgi:hypothetical protein